MPIRHGSHAEHSLVAWQGRSWRRRHADHPRQPRLGAPAPEPLLLVFETIAALLAAHGATPADIINIRTYLTDISQLEQYGAVRREFLPGTPPTSMTFEVPRLCRPEALIEIEVVAAVPARG